MANSTRIRMQRYNLTAEEIAKIDAHHEKKMKEAVRYKVVGYFPKSDVYAELDLPLDKTEGRRKFGIWNDHYWADLDEMIQKFMDDCDTTNQGLK